MRLLQSPRRVLFGESNRLNPRRRYTRLDDSFDEIDRIASVDDDDDYYIYNDEAPKQGSWTHFIFGFLYEDTTEDDNDESVLYASNTQPSTRIWSNALNLSLFASLTIASLASSIPVTLVPQLAEHWHIDDTLTPNSAAAAVLGTALGKMINGPVADVAGARRTMVSYTLLLAASLLMLALCTSTKHVLVVCFLIEFFSSIQWPCCVILLATHYRGNVHGMYEGAIYVTSLASRLGSLVGIPLGAMWLRNVHWRVVALLAAWLATVSASIVFLYVQDSPRAVHEPQNPFLDTAAVPNNDAQHQTHPTQQQPFPTLRRHNSFNNLPFLRTLFIMFQTNILPSLRHVLSSGTFWIIALAHTGSTVIRTSDRILGSYFYATSNQSLSENRAAELAVFLSIGIVMGLVIAGSLFASRTERERKWLVTRLYIMTIGACYALALLAIPSLRRAIKEPGMITILQLVAVVAIGSGVSVQCYHIPSLVGATFGCDKGLFSAYVDGIAYGVASIMWRFIANVISHGNHVDGGGWVYGWAAVALLLVLSAVLMVEFMEHYFCRPRNNKGTYETIIFA